MRQAFNSLGFRTYLNSLDAQRNLFSSQQSLVTTKLARINNFVSLYKALGGAEGAQVDSL